MEGVISKQIKEEYLSTINVADIETKAVEIDSGIDKELYLSMRVCASCNMNFSKNSCKKYSCQFCYKAYCIKCCVLTLFHPESARNERCCNPCYLFYTKNSVFQIVENFARQKMHKELEERALEEQKQQSLKEKIQAAETEIELDKQRYDQEMQAIELQIHKMEEKLKSKQTDIIQIRRKTEEKQKELKEHRSLEYLDKKALEIHKFLASSSMEKTLRSILKY